VRALCYGLLSALLLSIGWPPYGFSPFLFVAFVPLLLLEKELLNAKPRFWLLKIFCYSLLTFIFWNASVSWWVYNASPGGAVAAVLENALVMALAFTFSSGLKKRVTVSLRYFVFPVVWLSYEYLNHNWDLAYPWLSLGNGLAANYRLIQWYEYTGVLGGSLWIILCNQLVFYWISEKKHILRFKRRTLVVLLCLAVVPLIVSLGIYSGLAADSQNSVAKGASKKSINIVAVQPNIDPYNEKFSGDYQRQLEKMLSLASTKLDSSVNFLVFPETALTEEIWENDLTKVESIRMLEDFLKLHKQLTIVTGASTARLYKAGEPHSSTAQQFRDDSLWYDNYNTAFQLDTSGKIQVYHKSKLVPGVEKMPFPRLLKPLEKLAINLGGTFGSLGTQSERTAFVSAGGIRIAPIICYESVFGEYVTKYVLNGAGILCIMTNDGWWGDTPGYKQHLLYGRLRAIENRRAIVRVANTGISCFINSRGDLQQRTPWWQPAVISASLESGDQLTFYTRYGDYIGRAASFIVLILVLVAIVRRFTGSGVKG